jgi:hypothetical protein
VKNCPPAEQNGYCVDMGMGSDNVPIGGKCRCNPGIVYQNTTNTCVSGSIAVTEIRMNGTFVSEMEDIRSKEYVAISSQIENLLKEELAKLGETNLLGVQVLGLRAGSVVATLGVYTKPGTTVDGEKLKIAIENLRKKYPNLILPNVGNSPQTGASTAGLCSNPSIKETCSLSNKICVDTSANSYECRDCASGSVLKNGQCIQSDDTSWIISILVPIIVVCGLLSLIFLIIGFKLRRRRNLNLEEQRDRGNQGQGNGELNFDNLDQIPNEPAVLTNMHT